MALTSGSYEFSTELSAGSEVYVMISGENGNYIAQNVNGLKINLEAGKTYILSTVYKNGLCVYDVSIANL
jgi:hypothetical protein